MNNLSKIEKDICDKIGIEYYVINENIISDITNNEIEKSGLLIEDIERFIKKEKLNFNSYFDLYTKKQNIKILSSGYILSHSIFILLLLKSKKDLELYLKKYNTLKQTKNIIKYVSESWKKK